MIRKWEQYRLQAYILKFIENIFYAEKWCFSKFDQGKEGWKIPSVYPCMILKY